MASFQSWVDRVGANHRLGKTDDQRLLSRGIKTGDEVVPERVIVVDQNGSGDYRTVNEAFEAVPPHNKDPVTISVNPGTYM